MLTFLYRFSILAVVFMAAAVGNLSAQQFQDAKFGLIPDSLYKLSAPEQYPDTPYMITNKEMDVSFREEGGSIIAVMDNHVRLKVFDKSAREASIVALPYYFADNMERISDIRGWTHLPSGKRIALQQQDIRTVNINSRYNVKEFAMPSVSKGAILEYRYTIKRRYIEELPAFFLSHSVPTSSAKLTITYPGYMRYKPFVENYKGRLANDFVYTDTSSVPKIFTIPQPAPIVTERWMARDIGPTKKVPYITTIDDYRAKIKFLMNEFGIPRQTLENSWEVVVAKLRRKTNPLKEIGTYSFARAKGDSIAEVHNSASREAVQDRIFRYLNERVNFSGAHSPFSTANDSAVLKGEPSDQAAINQTLAAMLRGAGIEAHPVLLSSRQSGQINKDIPIFYQFNAQIVRSKINGRTFLMDASYPHSEPGLIPVDMYNSPGLLLKGDSFRWIDINPQKSRFDIAVNVDANLQTDGTLEGSVRVRESGYPVQRFRHQRADGRSGVNIIKRTLFNGYSKLKLDSVQVENADSYNRPLEIRARFEIEDYAASFSDGLEYRPMILGYRRQNPFEDKQRDLPVTLDAPEKLQLSYSISLPSGYTAELKGRDQTVQFEGASFRESYDQTGQKLNYEFQIDIRDHKFSTDLFPPLYELYERWAVLSNTRWLIRN